MTAIPTITLFGFYRRRQSSRTVRTAVAMELVDLAVQAVDGTKVTANAARIRTYDAKRLQKLLDRVRVP